MESNEEKNLEELIKEYENADEERLYSSIYENYQSIELSQELKESLDLNKAEIERTGSKSFPGRGVTMDLRVSWGRQIFESLKPTIYKKVCCEFHDEIKDLINEGKNGIIAFAGIIVGALSGTLTILVAIFIALLIIKTGLEIFCRNGQSEYGSCT